MLYFHIGHKGLKFPFSNILTSIETQNALVCLIVQVHRDIGPKLQVQKTLRQRRKEIHLGLRKKDIRKLGNLDNIQNDSSYLKVI